MSKMLFSGSLLVLGAVGLTTFSSLSAYHHLDPVKSATIIRAATAQASTASVTLPKPVEATSKSAVRRVVNHPLMKAPSLFTPLIQIEEVRSEPVHKSPPTRVSLAPTKVRTPRAFAPTTTHQSLQKTTSYSSHQASGALSPNSDLYWLSHIIHAEALDEPLNAQIAVGDVVMNRVHSSQYPNTVKGVIFQIVNGHYQFTPVLNGFIYTTPDPSSIEAAKRVLQGENLVPDALVYYTPSKTPKNSWVRQQPTITTIADFVFAK